MRGGATFDETERYRYLLTRDWNGSLSPRKDRFVAFLMLNPSIADHEQGDATITRCIRYAQAWSFTGLRVINLFALRSKDPAELYKTPDPVGPDNDAFILGVVREVDQVIAAWGAHGQHLDRAETVREILRPYSQKVFRLALTKEGEPRHPLYLRKKAERAALLGVPA